MNKKWIPMLGLALLAGCSGDSEQRDFQGFTAPSNATLEYNQALADSLPLGDQQDFEDATRGLIAADNSSMI